MSETNATVTTPLLDLAALSAQACWQGPIAEGVQGRAIHLSLAVRQEVTAPPARDEWRLSLIPVPLWKCMFVLQAVRYPSLNDYDLNVFK